MLSIPAWIAESVLRQEGAGMCDADRFVDFGGRKARSEGARSDRRANPGDYFSNFHRSGVHRLFW